jgi:hypothetical protein
MCVALPMKNQKKYSEVDVTEDRSLLQLLFRTAVFYERPAIYT